MNLTLWIILEGLMLHRSLPPKCKRLHDVSQPEPANPSLLTSAIARARTSDCLLLRAKIIPTPSNTKQHQASHYASSVTSWNSNRGLLFLLLPKLSRSFHQPLVRHSPARSLARLLPQGASRSYPVVIYSSAHQNQTTRWPPSQQRIRRPAVL